MKTKELITEKKKGILCTIDCTPTWQNTLKVCLALLENGSEEGIKEAKTTLKQMADVAQQYLDIVNKKTDKLIDFIAENDIYKSPVEIFQHAIELQYKQTLSYLNQGLEHDGKETVKSLLDIAGDLIPVDEPKKFPIFEIGSIAKKKKFKFQESSNHKNTAKEIAKRISETHNETIYVVSDPILSIFYADSSSLLGKFEELICSYTNGKLDKK